MAGFLDYVSESLEKPPPKAQLYPGEGEGFLSNVLEKLNPFEVLALPSLAVSEGFGAYREGKGFLGAAESAARGLWRGTDERLYPTMGEQLLPPSLAGDDPFGASAARFGIDVATDPLMYFGGPVFKAAGGGLKLGGRVATRAFPGLAGGAQRFSRLWRAVEDIGKIYGGRGGRVAMDKARNMIQEAEVQIGKRISQFDDLLRETGLHGGAATQVQKRKLAMDIIEDPTHLKKIGGQWRLVRSSGDEQVDMLAEGTANMLEDIGAEVEGFRDVFGEGFQITEILKGGKTVSKPFARLANYFPQVIKDEITRGMSLGTKSGVSAAVNRLAQKYGVPKLTAQRLVQRMKAPLRAGNIELARTRDIPNAILERDPAKVLPRYLGQVYNRMSFAKQFGLKGQRLDELLTMAQDAKWGGRLEQDIALELADLIKGKPRFSKSGLDEISRKIAGFQVLNKMGPLSTLSNMSQSTNTIIAEGIGNFMTGVSRSVAEPNSKVGAIAFNRSLRDAMEQILGATREGWASKWLSLSGFNQQERVNRLLAANAGIATMERLLGKERTATIARDLAKRGYTKTLEAAYRTLGRLPTKADDIERLTAAWAEQYAHIGPGAQEYAFQMADRAIDDLLRVGLKASEKTQHATKFLDLPPGWQTPEGRLFTQFKSFLHQQTRFLMREVAKPAMEGNYGPLYRAMVAFGIGGPAVAEARDLYRQGMGWLLTGDAPAPRHEFDWEHPIMQVLADSVYVGGVGLAGDVIDAAAQGRLADFVMGPTLSDAVDYSQRAVQQAVGGTPISGAQLAGTAYTFMPGRRALGLYPSEVGEINFGGARGFLGDMLGGR